MMGVHGQARLAIGVQRIAEAQARQQAEHPARDRLRAGRALAGPGQHDEGGAGQGDADPGDRRKPVVEHDQAEDGRQRQGALLHRGADGETGPAHGHQQAGGGQHLGDRARESVEPEALTQMDGRTRRDGVEADRGHERERQAEQEAHQGGRPGPGLGQQAALQAVAGDLQYRSRQGRGNPEEHFEA